MYRGSKGRDGWGYEKSRYGYDVPRIFSLTERHPQQSLMNHLFEPQSSQANSEDSTVSL
jgi:hypothetical protein